VDCLPLGVVGSLFAYQEPSSSAIGDNTYPGSAIATSADTNSVHIPGGKAIVEGGPAGLFSGYANAALNHACARPEIPIGDALDRHCLLKSRFIGNARVDRLRNLQAKVTVSL